MANVEIEESIEGVWGTFEKLLLVCAVNRHGTNSWDSIAKELEKRCSKSRSSRTTDNSNINAFTPQDCQRMYRDLRRRFNVKRGGESLFDGDGDIQESGRDELSAMVDELKKLRVEELKREVHRHEVSIVSLQLKVKKLQKERERSVKPETEETADLNVGTGKTHTQPEEFKADGEAALGGGSDEPDDRSFNESNSTNHKAENRGGAVAGEDREPEENRIREPEPVRIEVKSEPAKNPSLSGGSVRSGDLDGRVVEVESSQPSQLGEAVSDSKREKHSSDAQSSASLSRRKRRRLQDGGRSGMGGGSSGDELEAEEQSPAIKRINVKSQPLIQFMEMLRSHKHGTVFERRLPSQKTETYENLIRQHMDLETVRSNLEKGIYCDCYLRFYRDLLLVFTNAVLFYRKSSTEHLAARELRRLVLRGTRKLKPVEYRPDPPPQLADHVVKKPRSATAMIVCRRQSSSSGKPSSSEGINKNRELKRALSNGVAANKREKISLGTTNHDRNKKKEEGRKDEDTEEESSDGEAKEKAVLATKKAGVVNFLKRMKQSSPAREATVGNGVGKDEIGGFGRPIRRKGDVNVGETTTAVEKRKEEGGSSGRLKKKSRR